MAFLQVFGGVVLPVSLIAGAGALLHRLRPLPTEPLGRAILYLFTPALVFHSLATAQVPLRELGGIALFSILLLAALFLLAGAAGLALRLRGPAHGTFTIAVLFMNAGNYGLPVSLFAFGQAGLSRAVVFFAIQAVLGWSVGVFLASRARAGARRALRSVLGVPTTYAAAAGLLVGTLDLSLPVALLRAAQVMGAAAIPSMLVVLGIQVAAGASVREAPVIGAAVALRLVASAGVAFLLAQALGMDSLTGKVLTAVAGMPTAVFTIILATEFGGRADLAAGIVVASTIASLISVTVLLALLGAG